MTQIEKSPKIQRMEQRLRQMEAEYKQALREEREKERKAQERHKYMMGGCVVKYFPEAYDFSEPEMNRIIACAFSLKDVKNMIETVRKERPETAPTNNGEEAENDGFETDDEEENEPDESEDDEDETG